ncbi:MAG: bifunctional phosphoribosyl-AMP cyclohydrolase/phosphoribosyl-ATP diphosphatase HisIE [Bacteroidales bacterium]|nr:bifunctional phosphoribosyl-AMP cyclohydrolase/phosphoribosyl-ATP diphosphatase HisIE [Bacteroidales bacterium]
MEINFEKLGGLVPAIVQDADTNKVLMLGFMNKEAYEKTVQTNLVTFWSRTRQCLWTKGETSGNTLTVKEILNDCDQDTLLIKAVPAGPVCHTGADTCWDETNKRDAAHNQENALLFLSELQDFIEKRHEEMPEGSYTTSLFKDGLNRMAQKVGEEALELVIEATNGTNDRLIYEGSDMLYHLIVLLTSKGLRIEEMAAELRERHNPGWKKH